MRQKARQTKKNTCRQAGAQTAKTTPRPATNVHITYKKLKPKKIKQKKGEDTL